LSDGIDMSRLICYFGVRVGREKNNLFECYDVPRRKLKVGDEERGQVCS